MVIQTATWIAPASIPFFLFRRNIKTDTVPWGAGGPCQTPKPLTPAELAAQGNRMEPLPAKGAGKGGDGKAPLLSQTQPNAAGMGAGANKSGPLGTAVVPGSDMGNNKEDKEMHEWWQRDGKVTHQQNQLILKCKVEKILYFLRRL